MYRTSVNACARALHGLKNNVPVGYVGRNFSSGKKDDVSEEKKGTDNVENQSSTNVSTPSLNSLGVKDLYFINDEDRSYDHMTEDEKIIEAFKETQSALNLPHGQYEWMYKMVLEGKSVDEAFPTEGVSFDSNVDLTFKNFTKEQMEQLLEEATTKPGRDTEHYFHNLDLDEKFDENEFINARIKNELREKNSSGPKQEPEPEAFQLDLEEQTPKEEAEFKLTQQEEKLLQNIPLPPLDITVQSEEFKSLAMEQLKKDKKEGTKFISKEFFVTKEEAVLNDHSLVDVSRTNNQPIEADEREAKRKMFDRIQDAMHKHNTTNGKHHASIDLSITPNTLQRNMQNLQDSYRVSSLIKESNDAKDFYKVSFGKTVDHAARSVVQDHGAHTDLPYYTQVVDDRRKYDHITSFDMKNKFQTCYDYHSGKTNTKTRDSDTEEVPNMSSNTYISEWLASSDEVGVEEEEGVKDESRWDQETKELAQKKDPLNKPKKLPRELLLTKIRRGLMPYYSKDVLGDPCFDDPSEEIKEADITSDFVVGMKQFCGDNKDNELSSIADNANNPKKMSDEAIEDEAKEDEAKEDEAIEYENGESVYGLFDELLFNDELNFTPSDLQKSLDEAGMGNLVVDDELAILDALDNSPDIAEIKEDEDIEPEYRKDLANAMNVHDMYDYSEKVEEIKNCLSIMERAKSMEELRHSVDITRKIIDESFDGHMLDDVKLALTKLCIVDDIERETIGDNIAIETITQRVEAFKKFCNERFFLLSSSDDDNINDDSLIDDLSFAEYENFQKSDTLKNNPDKRKHATAGISTEDISDEFKDISGIYPKEILDSDSDSEEAQKFWRTYDNGQDQDEIPDELPQDITNDHLYNDRDEIKFLDVVDKSRLHVDGSEDLVIDAFPHDRVLSQKVKKLMWEMHKRDPATYHPRSLAEIFQTSVDRAHAIILLEALEAKTIELGLPLMDDTSCDYSDDDGIDLDRLERDENPRSMETRKEVDVIWDPIGPQKVVELPPQRKISFADDLEILNIHDREKRRNDRLQNFGTKLGIIESEHYAVTGPMGTSPYYQATDKLDNSVKHPTRFHWVMTDISDKKNCNYSICVRDKNGTLRTPDAYEYDMVRKMEKSPKEEFFYVNYRPHYEVSE